MTTQFKQRICFPLLVYNGGSYIQLLPRSVSMNGLTLGITSHVFESASDIYPKFSPPTPVDFNSLVESWSIQSIQAYFSSLSISDYYDKFIYEGMRYIANGNNNSYANAANAYVEGFLIVNNKINTDFDNLFANLVSSLNTLLTPISQISLSLLGINNIFPTLVHNLEALNENNVPVSIAQILKDKQIDVDMSDTQLSLDDSNLVTQLQNIYTILASQNANQSAISSAITNKDNQSDIINELRYIFTQNMSEDSYRLVDNKYNLSLFKGGFDGSAITSLASLNRSTIYSRLTNISNKLSVVNDSIANYESIQLNNKFLARLLTLSSLVGTSSTTANNFITNSNVNNSLLDISNKINNIETKLEQNLPFATLNDVTLNVDTVKKCVTQDIKENSEI